MKLDQSQQKTLDILNDLAANKLTEKEAIAALVENGFDREFAKETVFQTLGGSDIVEG